MASGNWVVQMLKYAGGIGILKQGERSKEVTLPEIEDFDPEKIVLSWCGLGEKAEKGKIKERKGWENLKAVKENKIFVLDDSFFNTPSQNVVYGIKKFAEILHPEKF